jgi:sterol O-acyltransferase
MKNNKKNKQPKKINDEFSSDSNSTNFTETSSSIDKFKPSNLKYEKEHQFVPRESYFDLCLDNTILQKSEFRGFFNLFGVIVMLYIITTPIYNMIIHNIPFKMTLFYKMIHDFEILLIVWPLFHVWTYLAFFLQILILKGIPNWFAILFQHSTQVGIFLMTTLICLISNMCTTHKMFTLTQCMIHFFKMHSYTVQNRDYRENMLEHKKDKNHELISNYPNNISFSNFFDFLNCPTFVYEESYPKTKSFRPSYLMMKGLYAFASLIVLYYIYTEHMEIYLKEFLTEKLLVLIIKLYLPCIMFTLILFFLVFECVLPGYAEISRFADRQFYEDWWNSTDLEEFNRKWNKVVHEFLYRHVYVECIKRYNMSKGMARFTTFFFSAALHEYCLCMIFKMVRPILLGLMIFQIPLIFIGKRYFKHTTFGNYFFWFSIIFGISLLFVLYNREYYIIYGDK